MVNSKFGHQYKEDDEDYYERWEPYPEYRQGTTKNKKGFEFNGDPHYLDMQRRPVKDHRVVLPLMISKVLLLREWE